MSTFHIVNFGCRATQADAAAIERQLVERGFRRAAAAASADVVVVNTCTVTQDADAVARQAIRHAHRENPVARILVTGCYAQRAPEELAQIDGVSWVVGNSHRPEIPNLVGQASGPASDTHGDFVHIALREKERSGQAWTLQTPAILTSDPSVVFGDVVQGSAALGGHTRPVLKIQDGCNHRCAYCVIPFVRGRSRSLEPAAVVEEIRRLVTGGAKEVVLSGINLGSYGRDLAQRVEFADVVRRILDETQLERLRISSIEPMDVTRDLVELFASSARIARHFHIPLQSGSDRVLAAMHRWYRAAHYARRVELIRERVPGAAIGADVIAGFPGETEEDHRATLRLIEELPFTYLHVFAFSKRPGTAAANMGGEVTPQVIKQRSRELRALAAEKSAAFRAAHVGVRLHVLALNRQEEISRRDAEARKKFNSPSVQGLKSEVPAWTEALSDNYLKVRVAGAWPANMMLDVRIAADAGPHLIAQPV